MTNLAWILVDVIVGIVLASVFDRALQFNIQLAYGIFHGGVGPTRYRYGPSLKIIMISAYLIPAVTIVYFHMVSVNWWWIAFFAFFLLYLIYGTYIALMDVRAAAKY